MNGHIHSGTDSNDDDSLSSITLKRNEYPDQLLRQLNNARLERLFIDAILSVDQEEFPCHRCVLAASSPYFRTTFSSDFQEGISAHITLHDISPWIMKRIIEYVYTGHLEITLEKAQDYLRTGHMLEYHDIVDACCTLLKNNLHPANCLGIKEFACMFSCTDLEEKAFHFALENFMLVIERSEEFYELPLQSLLVYLTSDEIEISAELLVWKAIKRWISHEPDHRRQFLCELFSTLRLSTIDTQDLQQLKCDGFLTSHPSLLKTIESCLQTYPSTTNTHLTVMKPRPSTLAKDMLVILGGPGGFTTSMVALEPRKQKWSSLPSIPKPIVGCSISAFNNDIYVTGGIVDNALSDFVWRFCCHELKWSQESRLPEPRAHHASAILNGILYVTGGITLDSDHSVVPQTAIHALDLNTSVWARVASIETPRQESTLIAFADMLYELGGKIDGSYNNTMATYNVISNEQLECTGAHYILPCEKPGQLSAVLVGDLIYIHWPKSKEVIRLHPANGLFKRITECRSIRTNGGFMVIEDDVYLVGGCIDDKPATSIERWSITQQKWDSIPFPAESTFHSCVHVMM